MRWKAQETAKALQHIMQVRADGIAGGGPTHSRAPLLADVCLLRRCFQPPVRVLHPLPCTQAHNPKLLTTHGILVMEYFQDFVNSPAVHNAVHSLVPGCPKTRVNLSRQKSILAKMDTEQFERRELIWCGAVQRRRVSAWERKRL
jgi:hypothetical protein